MVVKGAKVVLPDGVEETDVRVEEGVIVEIGTGLAGESFDAKGRYLLPALVDIGVTMRDGKLRGGTLERLAKKAKRNGFGTLVLSSLCTPRIDDEITLEFAKSQAERCRDAEILPLLSGIDETGGLADCAILLKEGAVGIEFESHIDGNLIRRLMEYAAMHGVTLFCHANDPALQGDGVMHEGRVSSQLGLAGIPPLAESSQVARIGAFAEAYGVDVVILGASTPETLRLCAAHPHLHAQVSIHHLLLDDTACDGYDTSAKIWPPLRDTESREAMIEAVKNGDVAMLTSLHTPVSATAKDAVFAEAGYGIEGLESYLPLVYTALIGEGTLTWEAFVSLASRRPAEAVGLGDRGGIRVGAPAQLLLFDPDRETTIHDPLSPYRGRRVRGAVEPLL
jgi:dihydroorotase